MFNWKRPKAGVKVWHVRGGNVQELSDMAFSAEHTLIAGATGCGKSTLLNGILCDMLKSYAPSEVRLVLIDPKRVELGKYRRTPFCERYVQTSEDVVNTLRDVEALMYRRYDVMYERGEADYTGAQFFIIIDELAPLMLKTNPDRKYIQPLLQNILQLGRAAGIHVIACTQAPNRQVIPAELVLNFSLRIGMRCLSGIESRQIVGRNGCELLPLHGQALVVYGAELMAASLPNTDRAEVTDEINYWSSNACYTMA